MQSLLLLSFMASGLLATPAASGASAATVPSATTTRSTSTRSIASAFTTSVEISVEDLWNLYVGPVEAAAVNTTVSPTPIASSELVPPPTLYYAPFPTGQQVPVMARNGSWSFPKDFWWGVASAAYQVEGAVKDEGRGPSVWDVYLHRVTGFSVANQTGDIADNQYYLYKQDIARIAALGVPTYSFSISWSRIMPFGRGPVNELALAHYDDLINTCIEYDIEPIVTLYHWDLPLYLQNLYGGWLSEEIVPDFVEYARVVFNRYKDRVTKWVTFNEPIVFCNQYPQPEGYFKATNIPPKQQPFYCGQSVLLSHAKAYHLGKSLGLQSISFKNNGGYKIPLTKSSADALAVQRAWDFNEGWFSTPTFLTGDYPKYLKQYVSSFLRPFTDREKKLINGTSDIFMHDAYASQFYMAPESGIDACISDPSHSLYPSCVNSTYTYAPDSGSWLVGYAADPGAPWLHKATDWIPEFLHYMQDTWRPKAIALTEFGFAEPFEAQKKSLSDIRLDLTRSAYYRDYMQAVLMAMSEGVNVVGTLAWSMLDNLEWAQGYETRFGMQFVNFTTQERWFKASFFEYINAFKEYQEK